MARSVNKVILVGNLGQDPEIKTTPQGKMVVTISIATSENYKDSAGEWHTNTEWHRITLWDYLAESAQKNLKKGSKVYIEGKLQTRSYEKDGITRYVTDVRATQLVLLDPSENKGEHDNKKTNYLKEPPDQPAPKVTDEDDDLPF